MKANSKISNTLENRIRDRGAIPQLVNDLPKLRLMNVSSIYYAPFVLVTGKGNHASNIRTMLSNGIK